MKVLLTAKAQSVLTNRHRCTRRQLIWANPITAHNFVFAPACHTVIRTKIAAYHITELRETPYLRRPSPQEGIVSSKGLQRMCALLGYLRQ
jgi:hypothetical protein